MKKFIPDFIKFPLWWLFKSPQRAVGWGSLWRDLMGLFIWFVKGTIFRTRPKNLSICVGLYNRSDLFKKYFIPSLAACQYPEHIELSVFDCGSIDANELEVEIRRVFRGKLVFRSEQRRFSRAMAFNEAVRQSGSELIFLCDADFSLPRDIVRKCSAFTVLGAFWFPIVFYLYKNKQASYAPSHGEWMIWGGKGLVACNKSDYWKMGGLDESFTEWGSEDEEFWLRVHRLGGIVIRTREKGLLHHWHSSLNPKYKKLEELADMGLL